MWGMDRMDPFVKSAKFTESLASFVGLMDKAKYAAHPAEKEASFANGVLHLVNSMMDDQWLAQASGFMKALEGDEPFEKFVARTGAGFIPYHAAFKSAKKFQDPAAPQLSQDKIQSSIMDMMGQQIEGNFPTIEGLRYGSKYVRPRRNWDGTILMPEQTQFASGASPWGPTKLKADPVPRELFENGLAPPEPSSVINLGMKQFSLLQFDDSAMIYDDYIQMVGESRREIIAKMVNHPNYARAKEEHGSGPTSHIAIELAKGLSQGKKVGTHKFLGKMRDSLVNNPAYQIKMNNKLGLDFLALIKESIEHPNTYLVGPVKGTPTHEPYEYPIPEMK